MAEMKTCMYCGRENDDRAAFCVSCNGIIFEPGPSRFDDAKETTVRRVVRAFTYYFSNGWIELGNRSPRSQDTISACWGIHIALILILVILSDLTSTSLESVVLIIPYMLLGWIPLVIWLYPILLKRMKKRKRFLLWE